MSGSQARLGFIFLSLMLAVCIGSPAFAQGSFFSRLTGTVVDSEGLPIPGASVKVKNNGTNQEIDLVSGNDGTFTAQNIPGGNYSVIVELAGFRSTTLESISVAAGIPTAVKVTMQVGTIAENVTVVGESATVVQTQSPAIATNLTGQQITSLPLDQPQRARFADVACGLQHLGHRAQLYRQRIAAQRHQHHARRHERAGQLPQDDRWLLRAIEPAARLG